MCSLGRKSLCHWNILIIGLDGRPLRRTSSHHLHTQLARLSKGRLITANDCWCHRGCFKNSADGSENVLPRLNAHYWVSETANGDSCVALSAVALRSSTIDNLILRVEYMKWATDRQSDQFTVNERTFACVRFFAWLQARNNKCDPHGSIY